MPATLGAYTLDEKLSPASLAEIWKAHAADGAAVVVKLIAPTFAADASVVAAVVERATEAKKISSPAVVRVLDAAREPSPFVALEYVPGVALAALVARLRERKVTLPVPVIAWIGASVARGLAAIHADGLAHGDVCPGNVLLAWAGEVKLADFVATHAASLPVVTASGVRKGKVSWMSPEQAAGEPADARSDLYSLGLALYEMAAGERLLRGSFQQILNRLATRQDPSAEETAKIPEPLRETVAAMLRSDRAQRLASASAVASALSALAARGPVLASDLLRGLLVGNFPSEYGRAVAAGEAPGEEYSKTSIGRLDDASEVAEARPVPEIGAAAPREIAPAVAKPSTVAPPGKSDEDAGSRTQVSASAPEDPPDTRESPAAPRKTEAPTGEAPPPSPRGTTGAPTGEAAEAAGDRTQVSAASPDAKQPAAEPGEGAGADDGSTGTQVSNTDASTSDEGADRTQIAAHRPVKVDGGAAAIGPIRDTAPMPKAPPAAEPPSSGDALGGRTSFFKDEASDGTVVSKGDAEAAKQDLLPEMPAPARRRAGRYVVIAASVVIAIAVVAQRIAKQGAPAPAPTAAPSPTPNVARIGVLAVDSDPKDAVVWLDGKKIDTTPVILSRQPVPHTFLVEVKKDGYEPWSREVDLASADRVDVRATLAKHAETGLLTLVVPAGADAVVDGHVVAHGPAEESVAVQPGAHQVRFRKDGALLEDRDVQVASRATTRFPK